MLGAGAGPGGLLGVVPYVLAALALDLLVDTPIVRRRPFVLALLAAPVHLVALVVPVTRSLGVGVGLPALLPGMGWVVLLHLAFGLGAGLLGWGLARCCGVARRGRT